MNKPINRMTGLELNKERSRLLPIVLKEQLSGKKKSKHYDKYIQITGEMELRKTVVGRTILESMLPEGTLKYPSGWKCKYEE